MRQRPTVLMFSGQGSQYFQMGKQLFEEDKTFRRWMLDLDDIARAITGCSVVAAIYASERSRGEVFDEIALTHPAIFMVQYAVAQSLAERGVYPDLVVGASLGSFAAASVAGLLKPTQALEAVIEQASAFNEQCEAGGMIAILASPKLYEEPFLKSKSTLASINFDSHFTVSANAQYLGEIEDALHQRRINFQRLPVRFAFHSEGIDGARERFTAYLDALASTEAHIPMMCCCKARPLRTIGKHYLWEVVRHPIRFQETIAMLEQQQPHRYIDAGPSGTLTTFLKYGLPRDTGSTVHTTLTPFGTDVKNLASLTAVGVAT